MAINIDRVYRTVQRILNVEQRGQLPPLDFNEFAGLAQKDIFRKLFYDKAALKVPRGSEELRMLAMEQTDIFSTHAVINKSTTLPDSSEGIGLVDPFPLPNDLYMLERVYHDPTTGDRTIVEKMNHRDSRYIINSSLTAPSITFPKYERFQDTTNKGVGYIRVLPDTINSVVVEYVRTTSSPAWVGMNVSGTPLYNSTASNDFDLHVSLEDELVDKILYYAALSTRNDDVAGAAAQELNQDTQIERTL